MLISDDEIWTSIHNNFPEAGFVPHDGLAGPGRTGGMSSPLNCLVSGSSGNRRPVGPGLLSADTRSGAWPAIREARTPWSEDVEIAVADVMDPDAVRRALEGVDVAYYLIHSLGTDASLEQRDRTAARTFAAAARAAGVRRIVYWAASSRAARETVPAPCAPAREVGDILLASGVPTAALQAAVIIGSGSAYIQEMLRYLAVRPPGHGDPPVGEYPHPADRRPRRAPLPGRRRGLPRPTSAAASTSPGARAQLCGDDAPVRRRGRAQEPRGPS